MQALVIQRRGSFHPFKAVGMRLQAPERLWAITWMYCALLRLHLFCIVPWGCGISCGMWQYLQSILSVLAPLQLGQIIPNWPKICLL